MAPIPKRAGQRHGHRSKAERDRANPSRAAGASRVPVPPTNGKWHPVAKRWYQSLRDSGQAVFYEPSDWATAYLVAESISRELSPQPVLTKDGVVMVSMPPKAAAVTAWMKGMSALMVTEGDRRRVRVELDRRTGNEDQAAAEVSVLDDYRRRLGPPEPE